MNRDILLTEELANFIIDKGAMPEYIININRVRDDLKAIGAIIDSSLVENDLAQAFPWIRTPQGYAFWLDIHNQYVEMLRKKKEDEDRNNNYPINPKLN